MMAKTMHGLGWKPALPDIRNYKVRMPLMVSVPDRVDMRDEMPPIGNQQALGSCTAWAATSVYRHGMIKAGMGDIDPSELAQYYWSRQIEGTTREDAGATITDAVKVLAKIGMAPESVWPYDVSKYAKRPTMRVRSAARKHMAIEYRSVANTLSELRNVLASGWPVVFGASVYESFERDDVGRTGIVPMPDGATEGLLGGHAMVLVGYYDVLQHFVVRNSWGTEWGDHGYLHMPYKYICSRDLCGDFWIIERVA